MPRSGASPSISSGCTNDMTANSKNAVSSDNSDYLSKDSVMAHDTAFQWQIPPGVLSTIVGDRTTSPTSTGELEKGDASVVCQSTKLIEFQRTWRASMQTGPVARLSPGCLDSIGRSVSHRAPKAKRWLRFELMLPSRNRWCKVPRCIAHCIHTRFRGDLCESTRSPSFIPQRAFVPSDM